MTILQAQHKRFLTATTALNRVFPDERIRSNSTRGQLRESLSLPDCKDWHAANGYAM